MVVGVEREPGVLRAVRPCPAVGPGARPVIVEPGSARAQLLYPRARLDEPGLGLGAGSRDSLRASREAERFLAAGGEGSAGGPARALGLGYGQTLGRVVLPQAFRKITPPLMNDFVSMQKDVGLISILGATDAVLAAKIESSQTYNFTPYIVAGILFILLAIPTIRLTDWYSARLRRREQMGAIV